MRVLFLTKSKPYTNKILQELTDKGYYYSRQDFEDLKRITETDTAAVITRKVRACWCPPYEGAYLERDGIHFAVSLPTGAGNLMFFVRFAWRKEAA